MKDYIGVVSHDPGSAYGIYFPDLPGCFAAADEAKDLLPNAISAIDDYLVELDHAPEARDIDAIREIASEDLAEGGYMLSVPAIARTTISERIQVSLDRGLLVAMKAAMDMRKMGNRSAFIAMAIKKEIERENAH